MQYRDLLACGIRQDAPDRDHAPAPGHAGRERVTRLSWRWRMIAGNHCCRTSTMTVILMPLGEEGTGPVLTSFESTDSQPPAYDRATYV